MSTPATISVVIPTFNRADFVGHAIRSVLSQNRNPLELIVVDDGSSDHTADVLAGFADRVRVIRQDNCGVSEARNAGVRAARGEWVAFLDSDDLWLPEKLDWQLQAIEHFRGQCGACFTDGEFVNSAQLNKTLFEHHGMHRGEILGIIHDTARYMVTNHPIWVQTLIARTELVRQVGGFDPALRFWEDRDFLFRLGLKTKFCFVNKPLVRIDRGVGRHAMPGSAWTDYFLQQQRSCFEKWLALGDYLPEDVNKTIHGHLRSLHSTCANRHLTSGEYGKARQAISLAIKHDLTLAVAAKWLLTHISPGLARRVVSRRQQ